MKEEKMPKKLLCRYNGKHKYYKSEQELLEHEKYCPDKLTNKKVKECPYTPKHVVNIVHFEKHIKTCKYKPKLAPKEKNEEENKINEENKWEIEKKIMDEDETNENNYEREKNKIIIQKLKSKENNVILDDEDYIFKRCYD